MRPSRAFVLVILLLALAVSLPAQEKAAPTGTTATAPAEAKAKTEGAAEPEPVVTHHEIRVAGKTLKYTATTGMMPIRNDEGETEAHIFFMAYTLDNPPDAAHRPLMFSFNGGPGSSSVWLHLGAIGPRRVKLEAEGDMPAPPFTVVDNQYTWLDQTDLVFIDPVGTGFSRPAKKELGKKFWNVKGDIESVGEFIRLYLTRYERWGSPLFLVGESYGTTRAAGLSGYLIDHGIALNGIVLVSSVLNFETLAFTTGNDLPYVLYLPSYTATAWFHKKLPADLQSQPLEKILPEVEHWAATDYAEALAKGTALTTDERKAVVEQLARYTGLKASYVENADLRVKQWNFCKELMRDENRTVGRLDSRFTGIDASGVSAAPDYDPAEAAVRPPFTAAFNNYVRTELGYKSDVPYHILGSLYREWNWASAGRGFTDVSPDLRSALVKNQYMKVFVASGHFDLATPFFATEYTLDHLGLEPALRQHISTGEYDAGHMMYIRDDSLAKLKRDVSAFLGGALQGSGN